MQSKEKYRYITEVFQKTMPDAKTELDYTTPFQLAVAVILSAQCTDKRVNLITPALFKRFPTYLEMAQSSVNEIYQLIKSCSYPNNKAKLLFAMANQLGERFQGELPCDIELLQTLPGIGRKTANVLGIVLFGLPVFPVDTHVFRVSNRIGLTHNAKTPLQSELELTKNFPAEIIPLAHHWLILHGRYICKARKPECENCSITIACDFYNNRKKATK